MNDFLITANVWSYVVSLRQARPERLEGVEGFRLVYLMIIEGSLSSQRISL